jgi:hypothetical protein
MAPGVAVLKSTGLNPAGGQFDFEHCTRKMFARRNTA